MNHVRDKFAEFNKKYGPDVQVHSLDDNEFVEKLKKTIESEVVPFYIQEAQKELDKIKPVKQKIYIDLSNGISDIKFVLPSNFNSSVVIKKETGEVHTFVFEKSKLVKEILRPVTVKK